LSSPLRPYDHVQGRHFDFTEFEELGKEFMSALASAFVKYSSAVRPTTAQNAFCIIVRFLRWIDSNQPQLSALVSTLQLDFRRCDAYIWENALALWRADIVKDSGLSNISKYNHVKLLNTAVKNLCAFGVLPRLYLLSAPKGLRASRPTRTLAEIASNHSAHLSSPILDKALLGMPENGFERQVTRDFLATLVSESGNVLGTAEEQGKVLMKINADRLDAVRKSAEKDFSKWLRIWNKGQRVLSECDLSYEDIRMLMLHVPKRGCRVWESSLFPSDDAALAFSRLLTYFAGHPKHRGRVRLHKKGTLAWPIRRQLTRFGGPEAVQAYLFPHDNLTIAVIVLILCDTGANVSVARTLTTNCLENSENAGYKIIKGRKIRAGGKLVADELAIKHPRHEISCVQAILTYEEISRSMRKLASEKESEFLFLSGTKTVRNLSEIKWKRAFKSFTKRHDEISHLPIQSKMIRPSVLMQAAFDNETGIIAAAALADHRTLSIINSYASRYPTRVVWERMVREFQSLFQAISIYNIEGATQKLGVSVKQGSKLFGEACRTGLGVACLDPKGGLQPHSTKGKTCTQLENCPRCPNRVVVASIENLRDIILFNCHLEESRKEWEATRPERWTRVWLPWLVFTQVVVEMASRGRTASEFRKAKAIAKRMLERGDVHLPPLW
jgi:hypothetical protein